MVYYTPSHRLIYAPACSGIDILHQTAVPMPTMPVEPIQIQNAELDPYSVHDTSSLCRLSSLGRVASASAQVCPVREPFHETLRHSDDWAHQSCKVVGSTWPTPRSARRFARRLIGFDSSLARGSIYLDRPIAHPCGDVLLDGFASSNTRRRR